MLLREEISRVVVYDLSSVEIEEFVLSVNVSEFDLLKHRVSLRRRFFSAVIFVVNGHFV